MTNARGNQNSDAITVRLVGGLGNQLFGYACGRALANKLGFRLVLETSSFENQPRGETPREFELGWLLDSETISSSTNTTHSSKTALLRFFNRRLSFDSLPDHFVENSLGYDRRIEEISGSTTLIGYFQSWKYFTEYASEIRAGIVKKFPVTPWMESQSKQLNALGTWIGVHVRRGDYTLAKNQRFHGLIGEDYYRRAFSLLQREFSQSPVVIFSDDPNEALTLISPIANVAHVVVPPEGSHSMESLILLSQADALVTANSSYSWWSAWLANPDTTATVAPSPWYKRLTTQEHDLIPPQWLRAPSFLEI